MSLVAPLELINMDDVFSSNDSCPQMTIIVGDKKLGVIGFLVVDSLVNGKCSGGMRMTHDITLSEVAELARAMTRKYAFSDTHVGGAKAGIICPAAASDEEKREILSAFGRNLAPALKSFYGPGGDIGVDADKVDIVKLGAGIVPRNPPAKYKAGFYTAYGVFVTARAALEQMNMDLRECSFALEGFGGVGQALAKLLTSANGKVVAVSTVEGAIFNMRGLDIERLVALARKHGDHVVHEYPDAEKIDKTALFGLDVNVIVPGARTGSITAAVAETVKANLVVPAANIPVTRSASSILHGKRVEYIPDFVSNWGGIVGCGLINRGYTEPEVQAILDTIVAARVERLMTLARREHVSNEEIATRIANYNLVKLQSNTVLKRKKLAWLGKKIMEERSVIPMLGRIAGALHDKMDNRRRTAKQLLRPLAIANIHRRYRSALADMELPFLSNGQSDVGRRHE